MNPSAANSQILQTQMQHWWDINQFISHEVELLDNRRFDEWLELLDPSVVYFAPLARNVRRDALDTEFTEPGQIAWFDEGIDTLRKRVAQINTGMHWAEEPASRVSRLITNVQVVEGGTQEDPDRSMVHSRFLIYQNRLETEVALFVGKRHDTLVRKEAGWRIARREIYVNQNVLLAKALSIFF
jgi:3-phenylpropionate/cinnamic acid dioxygenase small subunit